MRRYLYEKYFFVRCSPTFAGSGISEDPSEAERFYLSHNNTTAVPREPQLEGSFFCPFSDLTNNQSYGGHIAYLCAVYQGWRGGPCFCAVSCGRDAATLGFKVFLHKPQGRREVSVLCVWLERLPLPPVW